MDCATWVLACSTVVLAVATVWLAWEARQGSSRQIGVQTWLELEPRFNSKEMKQARKKLAEQMDPYDPSKHDQISEKVIEFFESAGTAYNLGLLNKELAVSSFSYHAACWWEAVKAYVDKERIDLGDDDSAFCEFEQFAKAMKGNDKITSSDLHEFLKDEKRLKVD